MFQPNALAFLPLVDYVKVDILLAQDQLASYVSRLKGYPAQLLAEKVETHEQVALCRDLGFRLFQGYYFARPESVSSQPISATQIGVVDLISELQKPDYEAVELARRSAPTSRSLTKFLNSPTAPRFAAGEPSIRSPTPSFSWARMSFANGRRCCC